MMNLFLSIQVIDDPLTFVHSLRLDGEIACFDLDNFSDDLVTNTAIQALEKAERIAIFITVSGTGSLGSVLKLFNALAKNKKQKLFIYNGSHPAITKMLGMFRKYDQYRDQSEVEIREKATDFLLGGHDQEIILT